MAGRVYVRTKPSTQLPEDADRTHRSTVAGELFRQIGLSRGNKLPWHKSTDPFKVLVAEYLLARTSRTVTERVFDRVFARYPGAGDLAEALPEELAALTREAGLPRKTLGLIEVARRVTEEGEVKMNREWLLSLPFVGDYVADAVALYAFGQKVIPLDRNFQRVTHRMFSGQEPPRRSIEPYRDPVTVHVADEMSRNFDATDTRNFHQGVLIVAWDYCRHRPKISLCPMREHCLLARELMKQEREK